MSSLQENSTTAVTTEPRGPDRAVVFFDGVCSLCNATVDFLIRHDPQGRLQFASLQGETAERLLPEPTRRELKTLVLLTESGERFVRSAAAVRILSRLGSGWKLVAGLLWLVPLPLRDVGYRLVASSRYRLFGQRETCRLPNEGERDRLLP